MDQAPSSPRRDDNECDAKLVEDVPRLAVVSVLTEEEYAAPVGGRRLSQVYNLEKIAEEAPEPAPEPEGGDRRLSQCYHLETDAAEPSEPEGDSDLEEFEIEMTKLDPSESVGLSVLTNRRCFVAGTNEAAGLIARWNAEHPEQLVQYGSVIVDVNGVSDNMEAMKQECRNCTAVKMKVQRRRRYTVVVPRTKASLGIDICPTTMKVKAIVTSHEVCDRVALATWNLTCTEGFEILPGDVMVEVNGQGGSYEELMELIRNTDGELRIVFERS